MLRARALVIGPLGACDGDGVLVWVVKGCSASSPPLGVIRPWIVLFITMVLGQVFDVEDVANVVARDHLEWSVGSWE